MASAKSFSLTLHDETRWVLICHPDDMGMLQAPPPPRSIMPIQIDERTNRWGVSTAPSAVTSSTTSAVRYFHDRHMDESSKRERQSYTGNRACVPPPSFAEASSTCVDTSIASNGYASSTDETILNNIRRLLPNTFVVFELLDFDANIPGHYVSMLFTSMSKNKLELKYDFAHVSNGFLVTYTIDNHFLMSWVAPTKVAAKQVGAKKVIELLKSVYPSIKTKHAVGDMSTNEHATMAIKIRVITRAQLHDKQTLTASTTMSDRNNSTSSNSAPQKEDLGAKLLKKMGWTGGGVGKDLQGKRLR
jgi:hypothetical protein